MTLISKQYNAILFLLLVSMYLLGLYAMLLLINLDAFHCPWYLKFHQVLWNHSETPQFVDLKWLTSSFDFRHVNPGSRNMIASVRDIP